MYLMLLNKTWVMIFTLMIILSNNKITNKSHITIKLIIYSKLKASVFSWIKKI